MFAQDAAHQDPEVGAHVLPQRPVDGYVVTDGLDQLLGYGAERVIAQHLYGAIIGLKGVVEGEFVIGQSEFFTAGSIGGGVFPTTEDMPARSYVTFYVQVDDLQAALDKVAGMGGSVIMPPMEIAPGMGSIAMFGDPADNTIGVVNQRKGDSIGPEKGNGYEEWRESVADFTLRTNDLVSSLRSWAASALLTCDWDTLCSFHEVLYPRPGARSTPSSSRVS